MQTVLPRPEAAIAAPGAATGASRVRLTGLALATAITVLVIIYTEIVLILVATVWSVTGVLHLGRAGYVGLSVFLVPLALWACWKTAFLVIDAERRNMEEGDAPPA